MAITYDIGINFYSHWSFFMTMIDIRFTWIEIFMNLITSEVHALIRIWKMSFFKSTISFDLMVVTMLYLTRGFNAPPQQYIS